MKNEAAAASVALHALGIVLLLSLPSGRRDRDQQFSARLHETAHLVAPPPSLTQRAPAKGRPSKQVSIEDLLAKRTPPPVRALAPKPVVQQPKPVAPPPLPAPPEVQPAATRPSAKVEEIPAPPAAPPPAIEPQEKPRLAFEKPGSVSPAPSRPSTSGITRQPGDAPVIRMPGSSLEDAIQEVARNRRGSGVTVGGVDTPEDVGGILETRDAAPTNATSSTVQLLSDPKGVDFRPYLIRVLTAVRRNWRAVFPESARLGRRGKVAILFSIDRSGRIPKLVIAEPSGTEALDRAAVAGISASHPFPPLPSEFTGEEIRLQLNFTYNMRE